MNAKTKEFETLSLETLELVAGGRGKAHVHPAKKHEARGRNGSQGHGPNGGRFEWNDEGNLEAPKGDLGEGFVADVTDAFDGQGSGPDDPPMEYPTDDAFADDEDRGHEKHGKHEDDGKHLLRFANDDHQDRDRHDHGRDRDKNHRGGFDDAGPRGAEGA